MSNNKLTQNEYDIIVLALEIAENHAQDKDKARIVTIKIAHKLSNFL